MRYQPSYKVSRRKLRKTTIKANEISAKHVRCDAVLQNTASTNSNVDFASYFEVLIDRYFQSSYNFETFLSTTGTTVQCFLRPCVICFTTVLDQSSLCSNKFYALCFTPILLVRYDTNYNNMYQM